MAPTVIYVKQVLDIISKGGVKGIAHITGGGFTDNIPRVFPKGLGAAIQNGSWDIPPVFKLIQEGLDIIGVQTVINFACPRDLTSYVHRVGRTARAGREGYAVTFVTDNDRSVLKAIVSFSVSRELLS